MHPFLGKEIFLRRFENMAPGVLTCSGLAAADADAECSDSSTFISIDTLTPHKQLALIYNILQNIQGDSN